MFHVQGEIDSALAQLQSSERGAARMQSEMEELRSAKAELERRLAGSTGMQAAMEELRQHLSQAQSSQHETKRQLEHVQVCMRVSAGICTGLRTGMAFGGCVDMPRVLRHTPTSL